MNKRFGLLALATFLATTAGCHHYYGQRYYGRRYTPTYYSQPTYVQQPQVVYQQPQQVYVQPQPVYVQQPQQTIVVQPGY